MATLEPRVDFAALSDLDIAEGGLDAGEAAFQRAVQLGLTNGDSLILSVGHLDNNQWCELGRRRIGPNADDFAGNVDPEAGKLATVIRFNVASVDAYFDYGDEIPEGPQRYTGGVPHTARVKTLQRGWMARDFVGAASGVQGHFDMDITSAALLRIGTLWALKMQALYGKA